MILQRRRVRPRLIRPLLAAIVILCLHDAGMTSHAATLYVPQDFATVQAAIDSATHGDTVEVAPGKYSLRIDMKGKNVRLRSSNPQDPAVAAATILTLTQGLGNGVINFLGTEGPDCIIEGFTIGGTRSGLNGRSEASPERARATIQHNLIKGNSRAGILDIDGLIQHNRICGNKGGGLNYCRGIIQNNLIYNNQTRDVGGAMQECGGVVQFNTIFGNRNIDADVPDYDWETLSGGLWNCTGVSNCIIWGNEGGPFGASQIVGGDPPVDCVIQDWAGPGEGNINADPQLLDPASGDFRLSPLSPCIDAASPTAGILVDFFGDPRELGLADIGADEFVVPWESNTPPSRPTNLLPVDGAIDQPLHPLLTASSFSDPHESDYPVASHWQADDDSDFSSPELDEGKYGTGLRQLSASMDALGLATTYYWRVRYLDNRLAWSDWSEPSSFRIRDGTEFIVPADYSTIQAAIDSATHGQTILVRRGTYPETIHYSGKNIALRSLDADDPEVVKKTVLDGYPTQGTLITLAGTEQDAVLEGFNIQGARYVAVKGNNGRLVVRKNWIHDNKGSFGAALYQISNGVVQGNTITNNSSTAIGSCSGLFDGNRIRYNHAYYAGAGFEECHGTFSNNIIYGNMVDCFEFDCLGAGGGMMRCSGLFINNVFGWNVAESVGGAMGECSGTVVNCTFRGNHVGFEGFGGSLGSFRGTILNCIFSGNSKDNGGIDETSPAPQYSLIERWNGAGEGNFDAAPRFVGDIPYGLQLKPDSPCIDAGAAYTITSDILGATRPYDAVSLIRGDGSDIDIGAYEYIGSATPDPAPNQPVNLTPGDGATNATLFPMLTCAPFSDPNPLDGLQMSHWQAANTPEFTALLLDQQFNFSFYVPSTAEGRTFIRLWEHITVEPETTYWWRVRHRDAFNGWSEWSEPTSFTTRAHGELIVPTNYPTIQSAIDEGVEGDEVVVLPGTYIEPVNLNGKKIILRSLDPDDDEIVKSTILKDHPVRFNGAEGSTCVLTGFTITGAGRGIEGNGTHAVIRKNCIVENEGEGIYQCRGVIENNAIQFNSSHGISDWGPGGIINNIITKNSGIGLTNGNSGSVVLVEYNLIAENTAQGIRNARLRLRFNRIENNGGTGVLECRGSNVFEHNVVSGNGSNGFKECEGTISHNNIFGNGTVDGAGLWQCKGIIENNLVHATTGTRAVSGIVESEGVIRNNIIFSNSGGTSGAGLSDVEGEIVNNTVVSNRQGILRCKGTIRNNIVWMNEGANQVIESTIPVYSCVQGWESDGEGNISLDPLFIDPANGDFRLQPGSPCIDMGARIEGLLADFAGTARPLFVLPRPGGDGSGVDIGAFEFPGLVHPLTDVSQDGFIDFWDLFHFQRDWARLGEPASPSNINRDEQVDGRDLLFLMEDWNRTGSPE